MLSYPEFEDFPILKFIGFAFLILVSIFAIFEKTDKVTSEISKEPNKKENSFGSNIVIRPYSRNPLSKKLNQVLVFNNEDNSIIIGDVNSSIDGYTKIPYKSIMDYEILSDETTLYTPTLGGVIMWGSAATMKKKSSINNVSINIYSSKYQNVVKFDILSDGSIHEGSHEFKSLQSKLENFILEMKKIEFQK